MRKLLIITCLAVELYASEPKKLFVEAREHNGKNSALRVTKEIVSRCPSAISITGNAGTADFRLALTPGASTLYRANGDVDHIFNARFTVSGLAKEACEYFEKNIR